MIDFRESEVSEVYLLIIKADCSASTYMFKLEAAFYSWIGVIVTYILTCRLLLHIVN